ncbi:MAG: hypothetical protein GY874_02290 [Desulfobacteraceae bacterium]|nr:hypothetical protein [Desulfobacteraceae bacterium]
MERPVGSVSTYKAILKIANCLQGEAGFTGRAFFVQTASKYRRRFVSLNALIKAVSGLLLNPYGRYDDGAI